MLFIKFVANLVAIFLRGDLLVAALLTKSTLTITRQCEILKKGTAVNI